MAVARTDEKGVVVACPSCGKSNRIPYAHLHRTGRCGHCGAAIPPPAAPVEVADESAFYRLIREAELPVVVDFWAPWCGPCKMVAPELVKVAASERGRVVVAKVNTDELTGVAARYRIRSIPTLAVFADGEELARQPGAQQAAGIRSFIGRALGA